MRRSNRHFMTVLGTGTYEECIYEAEEGNFAYRTSFVQMAVLKYVMPEYREGDRITVFVTEEAKKKNWKPEDEKQSIESKVIKKGKRRRYCKQLKLGKKTYDIRLQIKMTERMVRQEIPAEEKRRQGLQDLLQREFPQVKLNPVLIPEGKNREELDKIFECIYQEFSEGETVYFDFTYGLRNLPIQALAVVNYAKVLKNIRVEGLYYGAFALGKERKGELKCAQIIDMSSYSIIQDWTSAAEAFVKAGSGNQIYELYQSRKNWIDVDAECSDILESLHDLTNCLETSRGELELPPKENERNKKSIACAYESFRESYGRLDSKEGLPTSEQPLKRLFDYIYKDINFFDQMIYREKNGKKLKYTAMGMSVVQWALNKNLVQQGFTALNETIISYVCELYGISANDRRGRNIVHDAIRGQKKPNWGWGTKYPKVVREKWVEKWEEGHDAVDPKTKEKIRKMLVDLPERVFYLSNQVSEDRNTMNHFGVLNGGARVSYTMLKDHLVDRYRKMQKILEEGHVVMRKTETDAVTQSY